GLSPRDELQELRRHRCGIVAAAPLDPGAVLVRDQRGQTVAVVVRRDGLEAAAADHGHTGALRFDARAGLLVSGALDELLLPGADLERDRPLTRLGKQLVGIEAVPDLGAEAEPV